MHCLFAFLMALLSAVSLCSCAKSCGNPGALENGVVRSGSFTYRSVVRYRCNRGYALIGPSSRRCLENQMWQGSPPRCEAQATHCTNIPRIRNAARPPNKVNHGMTLKYQCNAGYVLSSQSEQKCQDGVLTGRRPSCIKADDLRARYVGCYKDANERVLNTTALVSVDLNSEVSITEQCILICGKINAVKYAGLQFGKMCFCGNVYDTLGISDTSCSMDCEDNSRMKCGDLWANSVYKTGCPKPIAPENGQTEDRWYNPNERALYQCSLDHKVKGIGQTCDGFKWIGSVPKCIPDTKCPSTFDDENLEILANSKEEGSFAIFRCKGKYRLTGNAVATCKNKKWTGKRHCELSPCRKTLGPNYTYSSKEVVHGSYAVRSCSKEGKIINQMCDNGKWKITSEKSCKESAKSDCTPPNQIRNGSVRVDGNLATFSCFSGFKLVGYTQLTCLKGIWDKIPPKCIQYG